MREDINRLSQTVSASTENGTLKKVVFSKPRDKSVTKAILMPFSSNGEIRYKFEKYQSDNKAVSENYSISGFLKNLGEITNNYRQLDIITTGGNCTVMISKDGAFHFADKIKATNEKADLQKHNREKNYIL